MLLNSPMLNSQIGAQAKRLLFGSNPVETSFGGNERRSPTKSDSAIPISPRLLEAPQTFTARIASYLQSYTPKQVKPIDLTLGLPSGEPPETYKQKAAQLALENANHQYTPMLFLQEVGPVISHWLNHRFGINVTPEQLLPYAGSQQAISHLLERVLDPEAGPIILPKPTYPTYLDSANKAGWETTFSTLKSSRQYQYDLDQLEKDVVSSKSGKKAKVMVVVSPNNPTGFILPEDQLKLLVDFARKHKLILIHDTAYSEVYYNGQTPPPSMFQYLKPNDPLQLIELHTASKSFNLSGARIAYAAFSPACQQKPTNASGNKANNSLFDACQIARQEGELKGLFAVTQKAFAGMLQQINALNTFLHNNRESYVERARFMRSSLQQLGWQVMGNESNTSPFFIWAKVPDKAMDSVSFAHEVIRETGVGMIPGKYFGKEGYVRIAMSQPMPILQEAIKRLSTKYNYTHSNVIA
jgi:LL-diaminopimelate aminotransferase